MNFNEVNFSQIFVRFSIGFIVVVLGLCDKQCYEFGKCIALNRCDCSLNVGGANCEKGKFADE